MKNVIYLFLFFSNLLSSQNYISYYEIINSAEIAHLNKNYKTSDSLYTEAFSLVEKPFKEDFFLAAINTDKIPKYEEVTYEYLKNGIKKGLTLKRIKGLKFIHFKKSKLYKSLLKKFDVLRAQYLETLNIPLRNEINKMIRMDQRARIPIFESSKQMEKVDNFNFIKLQKIIKENGNKWPGFSIIGENTPKGKYNVTDNIALMLLHFKREEIDFLKPYMLKAVLNGEMYPYHYARIIDYKFSDGRMKIVKNKKGKKIIQLCQKYGTYLNVSICDCENAEKERKKIGFEPLEDFYRKANSTYKCVEN